MAEEASALPGTFEVEPIGYLVFEDRSPENPMASTRTAIYPGAEFRAGRDSLKCSFIIDKMHVSKTHFRIYSIIYDLDDLDESPPLIFCEDLESSNGTFVNEIFVGSRFSRRRAYLLSDSDIISLRPYWFFRFEQCSKPSRKTVENQIQKLELESFAVDYVVSTRVLGSGICGTVFLASNSITKEQFACKIVDLRSKGVVVGRSQSTENRRKNTARVAEIRRTCQRFFREIEILSSLDHPNIVSLRKAFRSPQTVYAFMELCTGGDLFSYAQSLGGIVPEEQCRVIVHQILEAIKFLHSKGIAHRDIKPENTLMTRKEAGHLVVLTDFGGATYFTGSGGKMQTQVGTHGYFAPELYTSGSDGYTKAIDMWSLGILLVHLFTGDILVNQTDRQSLGEDEISAKLTLNDQKIWDRPPWNSVRSRPKNLVQKLLTLEPIERITAVDALLHPWFNSPEWVAPALVKVEDAAYQFWRPRPKGVHIIEDIFDATQLREKTKQKRPDTLPDATAPPFFGLDKLLNPPVSVIDKKLRLLKEVEKTGAQFAEESSPTNGLEAPRKSRRLSLQHSHPQIEDVDGNDIFDSAMRLGRKF